MSNAYLPRLGEYPLPAASELEERILRSAPSRPLLIGWTTNEAVPFVLQMFPSLMRDILGGLGT